MMTIFLRESGMFKKWDNKKLSLLEIMKLQLLVQQSIEIIFFKWQNKGKNKGQTVFTKIKKYKILLIYQKAQKTYLLNFY